MAKKPLGQKPKTEDFVIDTLIVLAELQPRADGTTDQEHIDDLAADLHKNPSCLNGKVRVVKVEGQGNLVTDGHHILKACEKEGRKRIVCSTFSGSYLDAVADAASANQGATHKGKKRSHADKRRAVTILLDGLDMALQSWTDRKIGDHLGVDHQTVAAIRKARPKAVEVEKSPPEPFKRTGKDGKQHPAKRVKPKSESKPQPRTFAPYSGPTGALPTSTPYQYEPQRVNPDADDPPEAAPPKAEPAKPKVGAEKGVDWRTLETVKRWMAQLPDQIEKWHPGKISDYEIAGLNASADEYARIVSAIQKKLTGKS